MIVGAGLAGMVAAFVFPDHEVFEERGPEWVEHQALLRFRSSAVGDLVGIPFRPVTVHKGIWLDGWVAPSISVCNRYSRKVLDRIESRSIWDVSTVERWIAPPNLRARLRDMLGARIHWHTPVPLDILLDTNKAHWTISTIPLSVLAAALGSKVKFNYAPIITTRMEIPGADVYQTTYFPSDEHNLYRASITGNTLIMEWVNESDRANRTGVAAAAYDVARAFGIPELEGEVPVATDAHTQSFGKIAPIDEGVRRGLLLRLTQEYRTFSLGRFATWRNLLLDDVIHDAAMIKRMMYEADDYDRALGAH